MYKGRAPSDFERELMRFYAVKKQKNDILINDFHEYFAFTARKGIRDLVMEAAAIAESEISAYLLTLGRAHYRTLQAMVNNGGVFSGALDINLPREIAVRFQEAIAAVWSQKLLKTLGWRIKRYSEGQGVLVEETCLWAEQHCGSRAARLMSNQRARIARRTEQLQDIRKQAEFRLVQALKRPVAEAMKRPVRDACDRFVREGRNKGAGLSKAIVQLLHALAEQAIREAQEPATLVLEEKFNDVWDEISLALEDGGDPLKDTVEMILKTQGAATF